MTLLHKRRSMASEGAVEHLLHVTPGDASWRYIFFDVYHLAATARLTGPGWPPRKPC